MTESQSPLDFRRMRGNGGLPVYVLGSYQLYELIPELVKLTHAPWDTPLSKQLVVSATLRLWGLFLMCRLHQEMVRDDRDRLARPAPQMAG